MNSNKIAAIAAYITWIGFLIAIMIADRRDSFVSHHLNQALVLNITSVLGGALAIVPILGSIAASLISFLVFVLWVVGIYRAATDSMKPLPIIGDIHLIG